LNATKLEKECSCASINKVKANNLEKLSKQNYTYLRLSWIWSLWPKIYTQFCLFVTSIHPIWQRSFLVGQITCMKTTSCILAYMQQIHLSFPMSCSPLLVM
jgi:hypothetical protein